MAIAATVALVFVGSPPGTLKKEDLGGIYRVPKLGVPFLEVPTIRTIALGGLYWGPPIQGNYHPSLKPQSSTLARALKTPASFGHFPKGPRTQIIGFLERGYRGKKRFRV